MVLQLSPPPDIALGLGEHGGSTMQIATCGHTLAARVRNLCAWSMLPYRFGVPVCSAPVTARAGSDSGAPRPLTGLVLCSSACVLHIPRPIRFWADVRCAPLTGLGMWCYQLLVCVARVCAHVCVLTCVCICPGARAHLASAKVVCVCESCLCGFPARVLLEGSALP